MENNEQFEQLPVDEPEQAQTEQPIEQTAEQEQPAEQPRYTYNQPPVYYQPGYGQYVPEQPVKKPKKKRNFKKVGVFSGVLIGAVALSLVVALVSSALVNGIWERRYDVLNKSMSNRINVLQEQLDKLQKNPVVDDSTEPVTDEMLPAKVYAETVDTVVSIASTVTGNNYYGQATKGTSTGSGVILSADGYVATNYHVVEGGTKISVTTYAGETYEAKLIGYEANNDIAVLKVDGDNLPYARVGSSDSLKVGDKVAAIGNPLGELTATMTVGYISAKDRMVATDGTSINMLQTDAAINSGNSGGPLFDMYGNVVGITTAKYSGTSTSGASIEGIGFAIPIDDVVDIIDDLMQFGYVTGAYLGVMVRDLDGTVAATYGLPLGVYVEEVTPGYGAEAAGVKAGDIIIDLGGHKVTSMAELTRALRKLEAGQETTITVFRSGAEVPMTIVLSEKPAEDVEASVPETQPTEPQATMPQRDPFDFFDYFFGPGY